MSPLGGSGADGGSSLWKGCIERSVAFDLKAAAAAGGASALLTTSTAPKPAALGQAAATGLAAAIRVAGGDAGKMAAGKAGWSLLEEEEEGMGSREGTKADKPREPLHDTNLGLSRRIPIEGRAPRSGGW